MKPLQFILLCLLSMAGYAQQSYPAASNRLFIPGNQSNYHIDLGKSVEGLKIISNVSTFAIIDGRPDTLALGYLKRGQPKLSGKISFNAPGLTEIVDYCNGMLVPGTNNTYEVVMLVKELWLGEQETDFDDRDKMQDRDQQLFEESFLKVKFDFYLKKGDNYYALYRFDTTLLKTLPLRTFARGHIKIALNTCMASIANYNLEHITTTKTAFSLEQIKKHNEERFIMPVLNAGSLNKGVYHSFDEFKNNNPFITEFQIEKGKLGDELYTKSSDGRWLLTRDVWGYCDGTVPFIKSGENYFDMVRVGNSYYFYGSKLITRQETPNYLAYMYLDFFSSGSKSGKKRYLNILEPLKLNLEAGYIY